MKTVNIQAAKTHLSRLVEEAAAGEEIILAKAGKPLVKLVPYAPAAQGRKLGFLKPGEYWESPDCWEPDEALIKAMTEAPLTTHPVDDDTTSRVAEGGPK